MFKSLPPPPPYEADWSPEPRPVVPAEDPNVSSRRLSDEVPKLSDDDDREGSVEPKVSSRRLPDEPP